MCVTLNDVSLHRDLDRLKLFTTLAVVIPGFDQCGAYVIHQLMVCMTQAANGK